MALTVAEVAATYRIDHTRAGRLMLAAAALVEAYAPAAPIAVKDEAVLRCVGWILQAPETGLRSRTVGPISADYVPSMTGALRMSGGKGLLSPWRVRRAGAA